MSANFLATKGKRTAWLILVGIAVASLVLYAYVLAPSHTQNIDDTSRWVSAHVHSAAGWFKSGDHHSTVIIALLILVAGAAYITAVLCEMVGFFVGCFVTFMVGYTLPRFLDIIGEQTKYSPSINETVGPETVHIGWALLGTWIVVYSIREIMEMIPRLKRSH